MINNDTNFTILDLPLLSEEPRHQYTTHAYFTFFNNMLSRSKRMGIPCDFKRGRNDFDRWVAIMGPIPANMKTPTVGRYNHLMGYIFDVEINRWNFRWQERSENCRESGRRLAKSGKLTLAQKASIKSPKHPTDIYYTCSECGVTRRGAIWKHHCANKSCSRGFLPIHNVMQLDGTSKVPSWRQN
jgi:hypothetical protein